MKLKKKLKNYKLIYKTLIGLAVSVLIVLIIRASNIIIPEFIVGWLGCMAYYIVSDIFEKLYYTKSKFKALTRAPKCPPKCPYTKDKCTEYNNLIDCKDCKCYNNGIVSSKF